ncbi:MAG: ATP-binding protein [Promethearchaeota archaeon]
MITQRTLLGTVIATADSPSTQKIHFVLSSDKLNAMKGEFVEIDDGRIILALITEIQKMNAYFASADSVKVYEESTRTLQSIFPTDEWDYVVCSARPLGELQELVRRLSFPVSPGSPVYRCRSSVLQEFLGLKKDGIQIGKIGRPPMEVSLDPTRLLQKHLAIMAISGAGKSYTVAVLLEELLKRSQDQGRLAIVVIDPHGEYSSFVEDEGYGDVTELVKGSFIQIAVPQLSAYKIREFAPDITEVQLRTLEQIYKMLRKTGKAFSFKEVIEAINQVKEVKQTTKDSLMSRLLGLENTTFFGYEENPNLDHLLSPGKLNIIDLSEIISSYKKQLLTTYICRRLFELRRKQKIPPFLLIIEEAHQFCPEGTATSKTIIETIAREGRKFFAALCLISQRPVRLSTTALSQCNTHLIMRIRNPNDLDHIALTSEGIDRASLKILPDLEIGEALIVGNAVNYPMFFRVRTRTSRPSRFELSLEEAARLYEHRET